MFMVDPSIFVEPVSPMDPSFPSGNLCPDDTGVCVGSKCP